MKIGIIFEDRSICNTITSSVEWTKAGYELIGVAGSAEDAKKLISIGKPDLLIMDIAITDREGIALSRFILNVLPRLQIIVVTANRSFQYAMEAARLQVLDYVLLPLEASELSEALQQVLERHHSQPRLGLRSRQLASDMADYVTGVIPHFDELKGLLHQAHFEEDAPFAMFLVKPAVPLYMYKDEMYLDAWRRFAEQFHSACMRLDSELSERLMIPIHVGDLAAIVVIRPEPSLYSKVIATLDSLDSQDARADRRPLLVYSSRVYYGLIHLRKAFTDTLSKAERDFFTGSIWPAEGGTGSELPTMIHAPHWETILKNPMEIVLRHDLPAIFQDMILRSEGSVFTAKCMLVELCFSLEQYAARLGVTLESSFSRMVENVFQFMDLKDAYGYVKQLLLSIKEFPNRGDKDYSPVIKSVITYMHAHYSETIGLSQLAEHFNMNASYLSRLLSQETGTTFVDMLAHIRIYHAKVLLREGKLRVGEIGEAVGYRDYSHFYMVFKKIEGTSPKEYIKHNSP